MHACPLNVKMEIEFIPSVAAQLQSIHEGTRLSINYIVNRACIHDTGMTDVPINDETAWGIIKPDTKARNGGIK